MKKIFSIFALASSLCYGVTNEYQHVLPNTVEVAVLSYEITTNTIFSDAGYLGMKQLEDTGYLFLYFTGTLSSAQQAAYTNQIFSHVATNPNPVLFTFQRSKYSLIPPAPDLYTLGASTSSWVDAYVSTSSVYIGGAQMSSDSSSNIQVYGSKTTFSDDVIVTNRGAGSGLARQLIVRSGSNTTAALQTLAGVGGYPRLSFIDQKGTNGAIEFKENVYDYLGDSITNVDKLYIGDIISTGLTARISAPTSGDRIVTNGDLYVYGMYKTMVIGDVSISPTTDAPTTISATGVWYNVAGTAQYNNVRNWITLVPSNNAIMFTNTWHVMAHMGATISAFSGAANQAVQVGAFRNGELIPGSITKFDLAQIGRAESTAIHFMYHPMATNDQVNVRVMNLTGANDITVEYMNLFVMGM